MQKASVAYMQTQITTTNQGELLLMLYAGAIKFLTRAREEIEKKNYSEKGMLISKAMDVIAELDGSLNMERGGELSKNLHQLYMFCNSHLLKASIKMNAKFVDDVINILEGLRSAYAQIIDTPEAVSALSEAPAQNLSDAVPRTAPNRLFANTEAPQAPTGPAALGISARAQSAAYMQQAQAAAPVAQAAPTTPASPAVSTAQPAAPVPPATAPLATGQASAPAQEPGQLQGQATPQEALSALADQAKQAVPATAATAPRQEAAVPAPPAPTSPAPGGFGFARQMTGNAMYRKMSQA